MSLGFQLGIAGANIFLILLAAGTLAWFSYRFFWRGMLKRYYRLWRLRRNQMARLMQERMQ